MVQYERKSYTVNGCVHVLFFWAYESITVFGMRFGRKLQPTEIPFLRWGGNRTRDDLEKVISKEIEQHGQVRVRRMVIKPIDEIYPTWDGENQDREVHNLIVDILEDKYVEGYWDVKQVEPCRNKLKGKNVKVIDKGKNVDKSEQPKKEKRKKRSSGHEDELDEEAPVKKKKSDDSMKISRVNEDYETGASGSGFVQVLEKMMTRFDGRFDVIEQNMSSLVFDIEAKLQVKFDGYGHRITSVEEKVGVVEEKVGELENEIKWLKERLGPREMENSILNDGNSKVFQEEDVTSPVMS